MPYLLRLIKYGKKYKKKKLNYFFLEIPLKIPLVDGGLAALLVGFSCYDDNTQVVK